MPVEANAGAFKPGEVLGTYELVRQLGAGAMGEVYQARHRRLGRNVAIKLLKPEHAKDGESVQRFFQEAKAVNEINHEHIVEIFDFVEEPGPEGPGRVYCVMELLAGSDLGQLIQRGGLGVKRSASIALQIAQALGAAHQLGVVHRDLKPDNVFVGEHAGRADYVKVLDFGVAKLANPVDKPVRTTTDGAMVGTPRYMAPEQAASLGVDWRADIYALGSVLYEMVCGRPLFEGEAFGALMADIITRPSPDLPHSTPSGEPIPAELAILVRRCVEKDPDRRPQSMAEVAKLLEPLAEGTAPVGRARRAALAPVLAVVAIVAVIGGAFGYRALSQPTTIVQPVGVVIAPTSRAPPPVPAKVRLEVRTDPAGAKVMRLDTNQPLGETPLDLQLERADGDVPLRIERDGFQTLERTVRLERDNTIDLSLAALVPPPAPTVPKSRPQPTKPAPKERIGDDVLDPFAH
jgi:hypothetical protein